ncbi:MAG: calcium-binding protein, partial [Gammaproteobacteria bacterium]
MDTVVLPDSVGTAEILISDFASTQVVVRDASESDQGYILYFPETGDQIVLGNAKYLTSIPTIKFADEVEWQRTDLLAAYTAGQASDYDDYITGTSADDIVNAGTGNDDIDGAIGNDTYIFTRGDGRDIISDTYGSSDRVIISGYLPDDVAVTRPNQDRNDVILSFAGTEDQITLRYSALNRGVDKIEFSDGTTWTQTQLFNMSQGEGTKYNDTISGSDSDNTLIGYEGDDVLIGGRGSDTYIVSYGDGYDQIYEEYSYSDNDQLILRDALPGDVSVQIVQNDVLMFLPGGGTVRLVDERYGTAVESIHFADGSTWGLPELLSAWHSDLQSHGFVAVPSSWETFTHTKGDGSYTLIKSEASFSYLRDKLVFTDVVPSEVTVVHQGNGVVLKLENGDEITLADLFTPIDFEVEAPSSNPSDWAPWLTEIEFSDGTTWTMEQLRVVEAEAQKESGLVTGTLYDDTYYHSKGDGSYVIYDTVTTKKDTGYSQHNSLIFDDVNLDEISVVREGDDAVLHIINGDEITLRDVFKATKYYSYEFRQDVEEYWLELVQTADGRELTVDDLLNLQAQQSRESSFVIGG